MKSVPITTEIVSDNPVHSEVYSIQHYVIKFVIDLLQVGYFLQVLQFPPPIKLTTTQALVSFQKYIPPPLPYFKVNIYPFPLPHFASIFSAYL
jgi:hypothetical protein